MKTGIMPSKIYEALMAENERHRLSTLAIKQGWISRKDLADEFGMAKVGVPYDQGLVSGALNGKRSPGVAKELEEFMLANPGPALRSDLKKGA